MPHDSESQILKITKKYIIDFLNAVCFESTVSWCGCDQFNEMPLFHEEEDEGQKQEQRGCLIVHKRFPHALLCLISVKEDTKQQDCYRITDIDRQIKLDDPNKKVIPFPGMRVDFAIADLNLGLEDVASYSFYDNINGSKDRIISLLKFLLNSTIVAVDDRKLFEDLLKDVISTPPVPGDQHYKPLYEVEK